MNIVLRRGIAAATAASLLFALPAAAQTAAPPTLPETAIGGGDVHVTIFAKKRSWIGNRSVGVDSTDPSSCAFMNSRYSDAGQEVISGYMDDMYGPDRDQNATDSGESQSRFRQNSPLGDASTDGDTRINAGSGGSPANAIGRGQGFGCTSSDYQAASGGAFLTSERRFAAGRAYIAANDTTRRDAYAAFDAKDYPKAFDLFRQSWSKMGYADTALMIGEMNLYGVGVERNTPEAMVWLRRVVDLKFTPDGVDHYNPTDPDVMSPRAEAAMLLAKIYLAGWDVPKNPKESLHWFKKADESGYAPATHSVGLAYEKGFAVDADMPRAVGYFKKAGQAGYAPSQYELGVIYYNGAEGVPQDKTRAGAWLVLAAKHNYPDALYAVGRMYDLGEGGAASDPQRALIYYKEAAVRGQPDAQNAIGLSFYTGQGLAKNVGFARRWFERAAEAGNADAMFNLAVMLANGEGGKPDMSTAYAWMKLADESGLEKAGPAARELEGKLTAEEKARADAILKPPAAAK